MLHLSRNQYEQYKRIMVENTSLWDRLRHDVFFSRVDLMFFGANTYIHRYWEERMDERP